MFEDASSEDETEYREACARLAEERSTLFRALAAISYLAPLPSHANFHLCRITDGRDAATLARRLLDGHGILVKDCTGKRGLENGHQFLRIAQRGREENEALIDALASLA